MLAFYAQIYEIVDYDELYTLVELARYYCALPILSRSLSSAIFECHSFSASIPLKAEEILPLAAELHHAVLFRECVVHIVGRWPDMKLNKIKDARLLKLIQMIRNGKNSTSVQGVNFKTLIS